MDSVYFYLLIDDFLSGLLSYSVYVKKILFKGARYIDGLYMVDFLHTRNYIQQANICRRERIGCIKADHNASSLRRHTQELRKSVQPDI